MYYEIVEAKYLKNYLIEVKFLNGKSGIVDLEEYKNKGGIFSKFNDPEFFKMVLLNKEFGVLTWDGEIDIAPETIYSLVTGEPLPAWMQKNVGNEAA
ncbi:MAG: DUF2442 domain-containing protein [Ignavibacteriaceae bacterium]|jgi:hypothetical protein